MGADRILKLILILILVVGCCSGCRHQGYTPPPLPSFASRGEIKAAIEKMVDSKPSIRDVESYLMSSMKNPDASTVALVGWLAMNHPSKALPFIEVLAGADSEYLRMVTPVAIQEARSPIFKHVVLSLLKDSSKRVRLGTYVLVPAEDFGISATEMGRVIEDESDPSLLNLAASQLPLAYGSAGEDVLVNWLRNGRSALRLVSARVVAEGRPTRRVLEALNLAAEDKDPVVRAEVKTALIKLAGHGRE